MLWDLTSLTGDRTTFMGQHIIFYSIYDFSCIHCHMEVLEAKALMEPWIGSWKWSLSASFSNIFISISSAYLHLFLVMLFAIRCVLGRWNLELTLGLFSEEIINHTLTIHNLGIRYKFPVFSHDYLWDLIGGEDSSKYVSTLKHHTLRKHSFPLDGIFWSLVFHD